MPRGRGPGQRPRATLSLETVLDGAVELLDGEGEAGLTFRGLAGRLGGGVGSLYWYVRSKEELLDLATDSVLSRVIRDVEDLAAGRVSRATIGIPDPLTTPVTDLDARIEELRVLGVTLFRQLEQHPWAARYLLRDSASQVNSLRYLELVGRELLPLDLTPAQQFYAATTILNFVVGIGGQMAYQSQPLDSDGRPIDREAFFAQALETWTGLPETDFPFLHAIGPVFANHDDFDQFCAGLDLVLAGIRELASPGSP